jgi:hypothetical protein
MPFDQLREKTVTISFRITETAFNALQDEAKKQNLSLNTLANQLFVAYSEYDRFLKKFHMIKLSAPTFKRILNAATDEAIEEAGKADGDSVPESIILAKVGELSVATAMDYLRTMATYSNLFDYSDIVANGKTTITLTHDLGEKGSLFLASYVESIFKPLDKQAKVVKYADSVVAEI